VERAHEVLALGQINADLAAEARVGHRQHRRGEVDPPHAAHEGGRDEPGHVAHYTPAQR